MEENYSHVVDSIFLIMKKSCKKKFVRDAISCEKFLVVIFRLFFLCLTCETHGSTNEERLISNKNIRAKIFFFLSSLETLSAFPYVVDV